MSIKISNQKFKKATRFNKNKFVAKIIIVESSAIAIRELFVVINSQELLNKKYNNFSNKFPIKNKLETNISSIFNNLKIDYKILLEKKKKNRNSLLSNISINFF